jgi:hypothetical protein
MYLTVSSGNAKTFSENLTEDFACLSRFVLACVVLVVAQSHGASACCRMNPAIRRPQK